MKLISDETPDFSAISNDSLAITRSISDTWGWSPVLSLTSAAGVFLLALAYNAGRVAASWADPLFWIGILVLFVPIAVRLLSTVPARRERIALLIVLAIALYFARFLQYPLYFTSFDEFTHWRTANDIAVSGHLFHENPLLLISSLYPGLEIATNALSSLTGLSLFVSGTLLIGVTRLVFVLALYLFYEQVSSSAQVAAIASLLYMANSGFVFMDEMFAYESLALPLAMFVLFVVARRCFMPAHSRMGLNLAIWFGLGAVVITHHVTSYALVAFLLLSTATWMLVSFLQKNRNQKDQIGPGGAAFLGLVLCIVWLTYTGDVVIDYLARPLDGAVHQLIQILASERAPRQLLHNGSVGAPQWERMMSYASEIVIVLGLPIGLFGIWRRYRSNAFALALALGALAFPVAQAFRFTQTGAESADRSTEFLFVGVAFVLAIAAAEFWFSRTPGWRRVVTVVSMVVIIFVGQMIIGSGLPWARMPGPYLVSADQRSIEPEGIAAAEWLGLYLGPGHRIATDRINALLMATYGNEWVVNGSNDPTAVWPLFLYPQFRSQLQVILQQDKLQYLVVDHRLSTALPLVGTYFNRGEPNARQYTRPIDPVALAKFDNMQNVNRVFDSGDIVIYDVEAITNAPLATSTPKTSCLPASPGVSSSSPKLAKIYIGTLYDIPTGLTTSILLTGIQQQQGNICGSLSGMPASPLYGGMLTNGPLKGNITTAKEVQFIVTGQTTFSFDGFIRPDGRIAGTYCGLEVATGKCSDYGLWSVSPAPSA